MRECGAKWREINARLRYADVRVIYTFTTVEKKKIYKRSNRSRVSIRVDGRRNFFIRFRKKEPSGHEMLSINAYVFPRVFPLFY